MFQFVRVADIEHAVEGRSINFVQIARLPVNGF